MSCLLPHEMALVGHVFTQAGSSPASTRSTHMLHFETLRVLASKRGMSKGQPVTQYWQPMQLSWLKSTMPFVYCTMAPGAGHENRQPGSSQCRQASFLISQLSWPSTSTSLKRISSHVFGLRSRWLW